jgi:hypothetical protein
MEVQRKPRKALTLFILGIMKCAGHLPLLLYPMFAKRLIIMIFMSSSKSFHVFGPQVGSPNESHHQESRGWKVRSRYFVPPVPSFGVTMSWNFYPSESYSSCQVIVALSSNDHFFLNPSNDLAAHTSICRPLLSLLTLL